MKSSRFFAADNDLVDVLREVEILNPISYTKAGVFSSPTQETVHTYSDLVGIGSATNESAVNSQSFLVVKKGTPVTLRTIALNNGSYAYSIDQLENPDACALTPAGRWGDHVILYGSFGSVSESGPSVQLSKAFDRALRTSFRKVKAFWVGPRAWALFTSGTRLTIAEQSPEQFDLRSD